MRNLEKQNGKWIDKNNNSEEFVGHVARDLEQGDKFRKEHKGKIIEVEITGKEILESGHIIVRSMEREV